MRADSGAASAADLVVAVSGMSVAGTLAPGMPVVRALRSEPRFAGRVVGFSYDPLDPPSYDPELLSHSFLFPFPMYGPERLLARLRQVHERVRLSAIIPTLDSELGNYIQIEPELRALGIGVVLPSAEAFDLRAKTELPAVAEHTGLRVPHSVPAGSLAEALKRSQDFSYPFVVKGNLHGATVIHSGAQLAPAVEEHASRWGFPVVLQEYVGGVEYDVAALGDGEGGLLGAVPMKKLQLDDRGKAWGAVTVDDPELIEAARQVVAGLRWRGPIELELMRKDGGGEPHLIELNPRFPAWIHLAGAAGQNLPWALLRMALGETVEPMTGYHANVMQLRRCIDVTCSLGVYEQLVTHGEVDHENLPRDLITPYWVPLSGETPSRAAPAASKAPR
jgi:carbamoyl-phosphate synthase large subunit